MHDHGCLKTASGYRHALASQACNEILVQGQGFVYSSSGGKRRPASLAAVARQRELRDDEDRASDVLDGSVHVLGWRRGILENTELANLAGDVLRIRRAVSLFDADEDEEAVVDRTGGLAVHGHGGR